MKLEVQANNRRLAIEVSDELLTEAESFFQKMDRDMDGGWRMGPEFIENPNPEQRAQIAADKLLGALSSANETLAHLMAGYILKRLPGVSAVTVDTGGEPLMTAFEYHAAPAAASPTDGFTVPTTPKLDLTKLEAMDQANQEISGVYRAGRVYKFAVYDHARARWLESGAMESEDEAQRQRQLAFKRRFDALAPKTI